MNERQVSGSKKEGANGRKWVIGSIDRTPAFAPTSLITVSREGKERAVLSAHQGNQLNLNQVS